MRIIVDILVLAFAEVLTSYALKMKITLALRLSVVTIVIVVYAKANGITFQLNCHHNGFSMGMALSFLAVYTTYFIQFSYV